MWVEVTLDKPRVIDRVEMALGRKPNQWARHVEISVRRDGGEWTLVKTAPGRAPVAEQLSGEVGHSQVLLLAPPTLASSLRIRLYDQGPPRWGFAELALYALPETK